MAEFYFILHGVHRLLSKEATVESMSVDFSSQLHGAVPDRPSSR